MNVVEFLAVILSLSSTIALVGETLEELLASQEPQFNCTRRSKHRVCIRQARPLCMWTRFTWSRGYLNTLHIKTYTSVVGGHHFEADALIAINN